MRSPCPSTWNSLERVEKFPNQINSQCSLLLYISCRKSTKKQHIDEEDSKTGDDIDYKKYAIKEESDPEAHYEEQPHLEESYEEPLETKPDNEIKPFKRRLIKKRRKYNKSLIDSGGGASAFIDGKTYDCSYCDFSSKKPEWISHLKNDHDDKDLVTLLLSTEFMYSYHLPKHGLTCIGQFFSLWIA